MSSRFLRVRQLSVIPRRAVELEMSEKGTPHPGTPVSAPPSPELGAAASGIPVSGVPALEKGTPFPYPPVGVSRGQYRIRQATLVQDGHSFGEQALYEVLWDHAQHHDKESRLITIGYRQMSALARLAVNNSKANIKSLRQKLAVEEIASFTHAQGTTYRVYSYPAILKRRRDAGLTHYIKSRGVVFVDPETGTPLTDRQRTTGIPLSGTPSIETGIPERDESGTPQSGEKGIPQSDAYPYSHLVRQKEETSTTLALVFRAVQEELGPIDDEAARRILESCYQKAPDATDKELEHFVRLTATRVRKMHRVENPVGFLISAVAKNFAGESFRQFREIERQAQGRELPPEELERYRAVVDDPQTSEPEKRVALAALGAR